MCVCVCVYIYTTIHKNDSMYVKLSNKQITQIFTKAKDPNGHFIKKYRNGQ